MNIFASATFDPERWLATDPNNQYLQIPLVKSYATDNGGWVVEGVASCEESDADAERLLQKGMDTRPLLATGYFNWDHKDHLGPAYLIGQPKEVLISPASDYKEQLGKSLSGSAMYIRGELFQHPDKPIAKDVWDHMAAMRDLGIPRTLGWSVQGQILERDAYDRNIVVKSVCRQLAITHQPKQAYTYASLVKSFGADGHELRKAMTTEGAAPVTRENLGWTITSLLMGECKHRCLDDRGQFRQGVRSALQHLTLCKGYDLDESKDALAMLIKSCATQRRSGDELQ